MKSSSGSAAHGPFGSGSPLFLPNCGAGADGAAHLLSPRGRLSRARPLLCHHTRWTRFSRRLDWTKYIPAPTREPSRPVRSTPLVPPRLHRPSTNLATTRPANPPPGAPPWTPAAPRTRSSDPVGRVREHPLQGKLGDPLARLALQRPRTNRSPLRSVPLSRSSSSPARTAVHPPSSTLHRLSTATAAHGPLARSHAPAWSR